MRRLLTAVSCMLAANQACADGFEVGIGHNFVPGAYYASVGYRHGLLGAETVIHSMGHEEPNTKPGPEICFNGLLYVPSTPVFFKAGLVTGNGKDGYNVAVGIDLSISKQWAVRIQETRFKVKEDYGEPAEAENLFSIGLQYRF